MASIRETPPVPREDLEAVERPEKFSQTALSHFDRCPRSAFLYWKHAGGPQSAPMARGEVFHEFVEKALQSMVDNGETTMPPEVAKDQIMALIRERTDLHVPEYEQNSLRAMAWNWAEATAIDPQEVVGLEQMIELELAGYTIRGKLDFAEIGPVRGALIRDYKTSINLPSQDEIENGVKSFQGRFYGLLLLFGIPEGEQFALGKGLDQVEVELSYPRYMNPETGELVGRSVTWTRDQLTDLKNTIEGHLEQIGHGFETGEFPALPGSWCAECPARQECPIPETYLPIGKIESVDEAVAMLELHYTRDAEQRKLMRTISKFHEDYGEPLYMGDYTYDRRLETRRSVDWEAVGEDPFTATSEFVRITRSTPFKKRKTTKEERRDRDAA